MVGAEENHREKRSPTGGSARAGQLGAAGAAISGISAALVATAAGACCVGPVIAPLVVAVLGAGGAAWAAGLKPYSPWLLAGSFVLLAYGFWSAYRTPARCEAGADRKLGWGWSATRAVLWLAAAFWVAAAAANLILAFRGGVQ